MIEKHVGALEITMHDVEIVQCAQALADLDEDTPYFALRKVCPLLLVLANFLEEVAVVSVLNDDA